MKDIKEVWAIVIETSICHGHGEYANELLLAYKGYDVKGIYPVFKTRELAQKFIDDNKVYGKPHKLVFNDEIEFGTEDDYDYPPRG